MHWFSTCASALQLLKRSHGTNARLCSTPAMLPIDNAGYRFVFPAWGFMLEWIVRAVKSRLKHVGQYRRPVLDWCHAMDAAIFDPGLTCPVSIGIGEVKVSAFLNCDCRPARVCHVCSETWRRCARETVALRYLDNGLCFQHNVGSTSVCSHDNGVHNAMSSKFDIDSARG